MNFTSIECRIKQFLRPLLNKMKASGAEINDILACVKRFPRIDTISKSDLKERWKKLAFPLGLLNYKSSFFRWHFSVEEESFSVSRLRFQRNNDWKSEQVIIFHFAWCTSWKGGLFVIYSFRCFIHGKVSPGFSFNNEKKGNRAWHWVHKPLVLTRSLTQVYKQARWDISHYKPRFVRRELLIK